MKGQSVTVDKEAHGHVTPRLDGHKARCGGPALGCTVCRAEMRALGQEPPPLSIPASIAAPAPPPFSTAVPPDLELDVENLAMLVRLLARNVRRYEPASPIVKTALAFLQDRGLNSSPFRNEPPAT